MLCAVVLRCVLGGVLCCSDVARFQTIDDELNKSISDMQLHVLGASLLLQRQSYDDAQRNNEILVSKIDALGGPAAIASNPALAAQAADALKLPVEELKAELSYFMERVRVMLWDGYVWPSQRCDFCVFVSRYAAAGWSSAAGGPPG